MLLQCAGQLAMQCSLELPVVLSLELLVLLWYIDPQAAFPTYRARALNHKSDDIGWVARSWQVDVPARHIWSTAIRQWQKIHTRGRWLRRQRHFRGVVVWGSAKGLSKMNRKYRQKERWRTFGRYPCVERCRCVSRVSDLRLSMQKQMEKLNGRALST